MIESGKIDETLINSIRNVAMHRKDLLSGIALDAAFLLIFLLTSRF